MTSPNPEPIASERPTSTAEDLILPLHVEDVEVSRRRIETAVVRISTQTTICDKLVEAQLTHERVEVTHVPIGLYVEVIPPVREEGDLTIMPVVEEVVIVERRLLLREEVHVLRVRTTEHHVETVKLREQTAVVTRTPAGAPALQPAASNLQPEQLESEQ